MPSKRSSSSSKKKKDNQMHAIIEAEEARQSTAPGIMDPGNVGFIELFFGWIPHLTTWDGRDAEERASWRKTVTIDFSIVGLGFAAVCLWSRTLDPLPVDAATRCIAGGLRMRLLVAFVQLTILISSFWYQPGPLKKFPDYWKVINIGGRVASFFTSQTIFLQSVYYILWPISLLLQDGRLEAALLKLALWSAMQGVMLTIMFYVLNWREHKWRTELRVAMEREFPGWTSLMAYTHFLQLPLSLFDLFCSTKSAALIAHGLDLKAQLAVATVYGLVYSAWIFGCADWKKALVYPFIEKLKTFPLRAAFSVGVTMLCLIFLVGMSHLKTDLVKDALVF